MRANTLATFERKAPPLDHFIGESAAWELVTREWVTITPEILLGQRFEFEDAAKLASQTKYTVKAAWSPTLATVNSACRIKATTPDGVHRTLQIQSLVNDSNRELQFMCIEAT